jgi:hypothetical protein
MRSCQKSSWMSGYQLFISSHLPGCQAGYKRLLYVCSVGCLCCCVVLLDSRNILWVIWSACSCSVGGLNCQFLFCILSWLPVLVLYAVWAGCSRFMGCSRALFLCTTMSGVSWFFYFRMSGGGPLHGSRMNLLFALCQGSIGFLVYQTVCFPCSVESCRVTANTLFWWLISTAFSGPNRIPWNMSL